MVFVLKLICTALIGYLLGNVSCGIMMARLFGHIDIREHGSGNAGTTNVLRTLGWLPSILTLIGDALKALIASWLGWLIAGDAGLLLGGFCAVAGHNWPVFLGFRGGKGIAPSLGMIIAINPLLAVCLVIIEVVVVAVTGYMSVASLVNVIAYPILTVIFLHGRENFPLFLLFSLMASAMAAYAHRANIQRLFHGEENKLDFQKIKFLSKIQQRRKKG